LSRLSQSTFSMHLSNSLTNPPPPSKNNHTHHFLPIVSYLWHIVFLNEHRYSS
jgi:hypothetical protein